MTQDERLQSLRREAREAWLNAQSGEDVGACHAFFDTARRLEVEAERAGLDPAVERWAVIAGRRPGLPIR